MNNAMATRYQPAEIEGKWYPLWEQAGYFAPQGSGPNYAIMIPPPNVTGTLHMGHAFQDTLMDALIRYQRMNGARVLWQPGSDHAGIATQMVVERQLNAEGQSRHDLGREAFVRRVWQWKERSGGQIMQQLRRLGASLDWSRERFTMDARMSQAVQTLFIRLYRDGLIYRGQRLVNWDPVLKTAISDLEVEAREEQGTMYYVRYDLVEGSGALTIATTRPETIPADAAIAVHPEDPRYQKLIGLHVRVPLCGREIPIIADEYVTQDFGTGCLKITPAHDFNDYQVGQRHQLPIVNILTPDARLNDAVPEPYRGLTREQARERFVADLEGAGLLLKTEPHLLSRPYGDRSGVVIEPYLTDQWFVDLSSERGLEKLTRPALAAVRSGAIRFVPQNWENTYFNWMENLQDWCISRQLWWGHRIPAWYDDAGQIFVGESEAAVRAHYHIPPETPLRQDEDVLDTWFSSALWPFATQGWPEKTADLAAFYPSNVLVTGFDIIFFWVARMILMGLYCMEGVVPFREVYIHGLVRDSDGQKMSKSKGNVIDPIDVIDGIDLESLVAKRTRHMMQPQKAAQVAAQTRSQFPEGIPACGTDALRFTFAVQATCGRDVVFDLQRVAGYRNFCNKLWNAARFVSLQCADEPLSETPSEDEADLWILAELDATIAQVRDGFEQYRFDFAANALYDFIWHKYCDWYLELIKPILAHSNPEAEQKARTRRVAVTVLETTLRLAHPLMPFITEEIWQTLAPLLGLKAPSIVVQPFPQSSGIRAAQASETIEWLQKVLLGIRKIRAERDLPPGKKLPVLFVGGQDSDRARLDKMRARLLPLGRLENLEALSGDKPESLAFRVGELDFLIPLAGFIDKQAELARLDKELAKLEASIARLAGQLGNARFVDKAPAELVANTRAQLKTAELQQAALREQRRHLETL